MKSITFHKSAKFFILDAFDKLVTDGGIIVEKSNPEQKVLAQDGQAVQIDEFAGIRKGSEVFIKSDLISLMTLCDEIQ